MTDDHSLAERCKLLENFDRLPDDAIAGSKLTAAILDYSEWTLRRDPPIPRKQVSARRIGYRVGDIRAFVRGSAT